VLRGRRADGLCGCDRPDVARLLGVVDCPTPTVACIVKLSLWRPPGGGASEALPWAEAPRRLRRALRAIPRPVASTAREGRAGVGAGSLLIVYAIFFNRIAYLRGPCATSTAEFRFGADLCWSPCFF